MKTNPTPIPFNKLMVVAHPDDEIIFGGAALIREPGWKVVCVTNGRNRVRAAEFEKVMSELGCAYEMWNFFDNQHELLDPAIETELRRVLSDPFEKIVTHNGNGEYGHVHHKHIHATMRKLVEPERELHVFHTGEELPSDIWFKKLRLLVRYRSQRRACKKFSHLSRKEEIVPCNYMSIIVKGEKTIKGIMDGLKYI